LRFGWSRASIGFVRVLFLENEDSFSWNVVDSLPLERREVIIRSGRAAAADPDALTGVQAVVIGPGPTDPERAGIVGFVQHVARAGLPLLGVCLGHQALGLAYGARLVPVRPRHGQRSQITFTRSRLLPRFLGPETVMRYHSLALTNIVSPLRTIASADGVPMALEHESLPLLGLQFHPDSYGTPRGREMIAAFFGAVLA
jgi:anthranilate synthase/aminodeoxychorismate synthase-like glutamine amidotransferase